MACDSSSQGKVKLRVPKGFFTLMEVFVRQLLKEKPLDVFEYGARFFERLLHVRADTGHDPSVHGAKSEDFIHMQHLKCGKPHCKKCKKNKHKAKHASPKTHHEHNTAVAKLDISTRV